jgi:hypothetical protein
VKKKGVLVWEEAKKERTTQGEASYDVMHSWSRTADAPVSGCGTLVTPTTRHDWLNFAASSSTAAALLVTC